MHTCRTRLREIASASDSSRCPVVQKVLCVSTALLVAHNISCAEQSTFSCLGVLGHVVRFKLGHLSCVKIDTLLRTCTHGLSLCLSNSLRPPPQPPCLCSPGDSSQDTLSSICIPTETPPPSLPPPLRSCSKIY